MTKWSKSPAGSEHHAHMAMRQQQNKLQSKFSKAESWMEEKLGTTEYKWTRQARWGWRVYDFWCHQLGIAVEVDGPEHDPTFEAERDAYNYNRSRIIVLRVRNFSEEDAAKVLREIADSRSWNERRELAGLSLIRT